MTKDGSQARPSGRGLLFLAAAAVVAALGVVVLLLVRDEKPEPTEERASTQSPAEAPEQSPPLQPPSSRAIQTARAERAAAPVDEAADEPHPPALEPLDLFDGEAPELISRGHAVIESGRPLHASKVKELYEYGKEHPGDARPHLLLAADSMNRKWYGFAVRHYTKAVREDPRARRDPRVLSDLVGLAANRHQADEARRAVTELFGKGALPQAEEALSAALERGDESKATALTSLVEELESLPD